jgi:hypothetical protein
MLEGYTMRSCVAVSQSSNLIIIIHPLVIMDMFILMISYWWFVLWVLMSVDGFEIVCLM